jgi:hypothetical protein
MPRKQPPPRSSSTKPATKATATSSTKPAPLNLPPATRPRTHDAIITLRLPHDLAERLDRACARLADEGTPRTRSEIARWALERTLAELESR